MCPGKESLTSGLAIDQLAEQQACLAVSEFRAMGGLCSSAVQLWYKETGGQVAERAVDNLYWSGQYS